MTSEGLGDMFEGDSADMFAGKFPLVLMGGRAVGLACADPGARTPIGASRNFLYVVAWLPQRKSYYYFLFWRKILVREFPFTPLRIFTIGLHLCKPGHYYNSGGYVNRKPKNAKVEGRVMKFKRIFVVQSSSFGYFWGNSSTIFLLSVQPNIANCEGGEGR